jgi:flagellum-specific ATP synthase
LETVVAELEAVPTHRRYGRVASVRGLLIESSGLDRGVAIGTRCRVIPRHGAPSAAEVVGFDRGHALLMPFGSVDGVALGSQVVIAEQDAVVHPERSWLGRVVNALGEPIDGGPPLSRGPVGYRLRASPPQAHARKRIGGKIDLGVRSVNTFLTTCSGQRMGIFSGSGIGKSVLLSMMARYTSSDVNVIGLIGERGREVQEFIHDDLGPEGLARSVVVVATGDESALMRRQGAYLTMAVAEFFRDAGNDVLCLMDSVTRFAMAQREIGLSGGEPPATRGYTPTVFAELPRLLERAGPGTDAGTITGLFTVLVEGDDHNEPVADSVRGILDGHIVLDRSIAERGRYPPVNILRSVSRSMPECNSDDENRLVAAARALMATYNDMEELIRIGAYRSGSDARVDQAIKYREPLERFLAQDMREGSTLAEGYEQLADVLKGVVN